MVHRLWIFNHYAGFPETVPATRTFELSSRLVAAGWDVTVIAAGFNHYTFEEDWPQGGQGTTTTRNGVRWVFLRTVPYKRNGPRRLANMLVYARNASRWARDEQAPDAIIGTTVHPFAAATARQLARRLRIPFFYEVTDLWPATFADLNASRLVRAGGAGLSYLERAAFRDAAGVIGLIPGIPDYARERHGLELRQFVYVPNGVATPRCPPERNEERGLVIYAGGFAPAHGLDTVIDAAQLLLDTDITIHLYGGGPERQRLQERVIALGLRNVEFAGWVTKSSIQTRLLAAECCLCTAQSMAVHRFGMSFNKLFDYFGAGSPVVFAVDSTNNPVAESGAGVTVRAGDAAALAGAIREVHNMTPEERQRMGRRGWDFLTNEHDFDVLAERLDKALRRTCAG